MCAETIRKKRGGEPVHPHFSPQTISTLQTWKNHPQVKIERCKTFATSSSPEKIEWAVKTLIEFSTSYDPIYRKNAHLALANILDDKNTTSEFITTLHKELKSVVDKGCAEDAQFATAVASRLVSLRNNEMEPLANAILSRFENILKKSQIGHDELMFIDQVLYFAGDVFRAKDKTDKQVLAAAQNILEKSKGDEVKDLAAADALDYLFKSVKPKEEVQTLNELETHFSNIEEKLKSHALGDVAVALNLVSSILADERENIDQEDLHILLQIIKEKFDEVQKNLNLKDEETRSFISGMAMLTKSLYKAKRNGIVSDDAEKIADEFYTPLSNIWNYEEHRVYLTSISWDFDTLISEKLKLPQDGFQKYIDGQGTF